MSVAEHPLGAPIFLVEVLFPSDFYSDVAKKTAGWLAAGAKLVVLADPAKKLLFAHRPGKPVQTLSNEDTLDASDVVSGWRVPVREIFEAGDELELTVQDLEGAGLTAEEIALSPEIGAWAEDGERQSGPEYVEQLRQTLRPIPTRPRVETG
jgi:hypothetical protein